jgi:anti-sigma B factor antagonist
VFDAKLVGGSEIRLSGRFDASQVDKARAVFDSITKTCIVDFEDLDYISSGGLSVLLAAQKRLSQSGQCLKLQNMNVHIRQVFEYAGFNRIFDIQ